MMPFLGNYSFFYGQTDQPTDRPTDKPSYRSSFPELKKRHKLGTLSQVPLPLPPPSELGTSLSEILLTVFLKFVELGLTDQLSSILVSIHLRMLGHSIWGVGPPSQLLGQCIFFKPSLNS